MKEMVHLFYSGRKEAEYEGIRRIRESAGEVIDATRRTLGLHLCVDRGSVPHQLFEALIEQHRPVDSDTREGAAYPPPSLYHVNITREWSDRDCDQASLVMVKAWGSWLRSDLVDGGGKLLVDVSRTIGDGTVDPRALCYASNGLTVDEHVKERWESSGFMAHRWIAVEAARGEVYSQRVIAWPRKHKRHFGLFSDVQLPPASPTMIRKPYPDFDPVTRPNMCYVKDSAVYADVQMHYRKSDLARIEAFDIAHSLEGGDGFGFQYLIISKRAYELFRGMNLPLRYVPVVIEG